MLLLGFLFREAEESWSSAPFAQDVNRDIKLLHPGGPLFNLLFLFILSFLLISLTFDLFELKNEERQVEFVRVKLFDWTGASGTERLRNGLKLY